MTMTVMLGKPAVIRPIRRSPGSCFLPDLECAQSLRPLGLRDDVRHHGKARTVLRPFQQMLYVLAGPLEDGLHPAVVEVAHPPAHTMQHGHPLAGIPEVDALNPARDQHPKTNHSKTLRPVHRIRGPSRAGLALCLCDSPGKGTDDDRQVNISPSSPATVAGHGRSPSITVIVMKFR